MTNAVSVLWRAVAILLSLAGIAAFIIFFVPEMNVFWLILSPMIFAVYQIPAVAVYVLWKRRRNHVQSPPED